MLTPKQFDDILNNDEKFKKKLKERNDSIYWSLYEDINSEWNARDIVFELAKKINK